MGLVTDKTMKSRKPTASTMELFSEIFNRLQESANVIKISVLKVAGFLDLPLFFGHAR